MSIKDEYYIQEIDNSLAGKICKLCHYAHRVPKCTHSYGLFKKNGEIVGCVVYGVTASNSINKSICGNDEYLNVYELNRLYVDDNLPRNLESFLIGNSLKMLDKEIIVSYADEGQNHIGVIYQATNFLYTGTTKPHAPDWEEIDENGNRLHCRAVYKKWGNIENIQKAIDNGANIYRVPRSVKHRYVYFNCDRRRKRELMKKLQFPILPYPKQTTSVPITSTTNISDYDEFRPRKRGRLF